MANTTYQIPLNDPERVADAMAAVMQHLIHWKRVYNIDFVSLIRVGQNVELTFNNPIPLDERKAIRVSL